MKNLIVFAAASLLAPMVSAQSLYVAPFYSQFSADDITTVDGVGITTADIETNNGDGYGIELGTYINEDFSLGLIVAQREFDFGSAATSVVPAGLLAPTEVAFPVTVDSGTEIFSYGLVANYALSVTEQFSLVLTGEVGVADITAQTITFQPAAGPAAIVPEGERSETYYGAGFSLEYAFTDSVSVGLSYRYYDFGQAETKPEQNDETLTAGMNFEFGTDVYDVTADEFAVTLRYRF